VAKDPRTKNSEVKNREMTQITALRSFFDQYYPLLAGMPKPFHWQRELFFQFSQGEFPSEIDLPTGTGKTSLMDVWFLALVWQARNSQLSIPRRLVWVVNRRVVVDQATDRAAGIVTNVQKLPDDYRKALRCLSITEQEAPAISTLRGEKADNRAWSKDPSRPAIVIGTVDMIGSRLLFSGYGDGPYYRPQHAGLLAVDTLLINDEAHLTPAFVDLLNGISRRNPARHIPGKMFRFISLSATHSGEARGQRFPASLENDMAESETFRERVTGYKRLNLHPVADNKKLETRMMELAIKPGAARTIVFIEQPQKALDVFHKINKLHPGRIELLTGTMRGFERDKLLDTPVFKALINEAQPSEPVWLVATSAGEVGIDITSEREVTSLVTADRLIQRFGRLNRFGKGRGEAHVVYTAPKENDSALVKTLEYLENLENLDGGKDIRCFSLRENPPGALAQTELPPIAELHDWLIELWCQTSRPVKGYPPVHDWLHGKQDDDGPETEVAWRDDIQYLTSDSVSKQNRLLIFKQHRVLAREKLREPTGRVLTKLEDLAREAPTTALLIIRRDRSITVCTLQEAIKGEDLDYALVLLPTGIGRLVQGMFEAQQSKDHDSSYDVADQTLEHEPRRQRFICEQNGDGGYLLTRLQVEQVEEPFQVDDLKKFADSNGSLVLKVPIEGSEEASDSERYLIYLRERSKKAGSNNAPLLATHTDDVSRNAGILAELLLPDLASAFREAGRLHDAGKDRKIWQRAMGNYKEIVVAKPVGPSNGRGLAGYRHELGSLVEARRKGAITSAAEAADLILHLIASHHGHARPHYPQDAHDACAIQDSSDAMVESCERFGRLVDQWGPWGLAYLESLFKAADGIASARAEESVMVEAQPDDEQY
jgi:CRISPR-associated endonuclease/helicase Cas3